MEDRLRKIIVEYLGVEPDRVVANASLIDDLGGDSLDNIEILMAVEEEFGIEITDDDEWDENVSFGSILAIVQSKI